MIRKMIVWGTVLAGVAMGSLPSHAASAPVHDPFRVLVRPPERPKPPRGHGGGGKIVVPPAKKQLALQVRAVVGESRRWVALLRYEGKEHIVEAGWKPKDESFTVRRIDERGVLVEGVDDEGQRQRFLF